MTLTHFVNIPANTDSIKESFSKFKEDVLQNCGKGVEGIVEEIFMRPEKLHLTITMLSLLEEQDHVRAKEALNYCKENIIIPALDTSGPVTIELKGIGYMGNNPSNVKVLYIKPHDASGCLQSISDEVNDYYINKGLSVREYPTVSLHLTAMNTQYAKYKPGMPKPKKSFDATNIIKEHENTFFGQINLNSMYISKLGVQGDDGYYYTTDKIEF